MPLVLPQRRVSTAAFTERPAGSVLNPDHPLVRMKALPFLNIGDVAGSFSYRDASGNGNNGTLQTAPAGRWSHVTGRGCLSFNGSTDYVLCGSSATVNQPGDATLLCGFAWDGNYAGSTCPAMCGTSSVLNIGILCSAGNTIGYMGTGVATASYAGCNDGKFHLFALSRRFVSSFSWLYSVAIDGTLLANNASPGGVGPSPPDTSSTFAIGQYGSYAGYRFTGRVADVALFSIRLPPPALARLTDPGNVMLDTGGCPLLLPPRRKTFKSAATGGAFDPSASDWWTQTPEPVRARAASPSLAPAQSDINAKWLPSVGTKGGVIRYGRIKQTQRPDAYTVNQDHPLVRARQILLSNFGREPGSLFYRDDSNNFNHGTLMNYIGVQNTPMDCWTHIIGRPFLSFNGATDYVQMSNKLPLAGGDFTVCLWCYKVGVVSYPRAFSTMSNSPYNGIEINFYDGTTDNLPYGETGNANTTYMAFGPAPITLNTPNHIAVTLQGNVLRCLVNGISGSPSGAFYGGSAMLTPNIGRFPGSGSNYFYGLLADVMVCSVALSQSVISRLAEPGNVMLNTGDAPLLLSPRRRSFAVGSGSPPSFDPSASNWWRQYDDRFFNQLYPVPH